MKTAITIALMLTTFLTGIAGQSNENYNATCAALSHEHKGAFEHTKFWGKKAFVSHQGILSNEVAAIKAVFHLDKTTPDEARAWFSKNNIPVGSNSYQGCVKGYHYSSFMRKIDADSWLVFSFSGSSNGLGEFLRGERLGSIYLVRKEKQRRWIEDIVPTDAYYNGLLFKNNHPNLELMKVGADVEVETNL